MGRCNRNLLYNMTSIKKYIPLRWMTSRCTFVMIVLVSALTVHVLYYSLTTLSSKYSSTNGVIYPSFSESKETVRIATEAAVPRQVMTSEDDVMVGVMAERERQYRAMCSSSVKGDVIEVLYNLPNNISVCPVYLAGSTFWKQVFYYLSKGTHDPSEKSPFDLDRYSVHAAGKDKVKAMHYDNFHAKEKAQVEATKKVMFVREPYSRMWSAYLDKFLLLDAWLDHGESIARRRGDIGVRVAYQLCPQDITLEEFVTFAVTRSVDPRWKPATKVCNPCVFRPHVVGKMETFSQDSAFVLKQAGLDSLSARFDHALHVEHEMTMLTQYNFRLYKNEPKLRACVTHGGITARLWKVFVMKGYIGEGVNQPKTAMLKLDGLETTDMAEKKATQLLLAAHRESPPMTSDQLASYRWRVMTSQFAKLPRKLLETFVDKFIDDFLLFGYPPRPSDVFVAVDVNDTLTSSGKAKAFGFVRHPLVVT